MITREAAAMTDVRKCRDRNHDNYHASTLVALSWIILSLAVAMTGIMGVAGDAASDKVVLQAFKEGVTNGNALGWTSSDSCQWAGVSCDTAGNVVQLRVKRFGLTGTVTPDLHKLASLTFLELNFNAFTGAMPTLANMAALTTAFLDDNDFDSIPADFFDGLTAIKEIWIDNNPNLNASSGGWSMPAAMPATLTLLSMNNASATGAVPEYMGAMPSLAEWNAAYNSFRGPIPASFETSGIQVLLLNNQAGTKLSGGVEFIGGMVALTKLYLHANSFTGPVPDGITGAAGLKSIRLSANHLVGRLPLALGSLPALTDVWVAGNYFSGEQPVLPADSYITPTGQESTYCAAPGEKCAAKVDVLLDFLAAANWSQVIAESWVGADPCTNSWSGVSCDATGAVTSVTLRKASLSGTLSTALANLTSLTTLDVSGNALTGAIPSQLTSLASLTKVDVSNNNLSPPLPTFAPTVNFIYSGNPLLAATPPPAIPPVAPPPTETPPPTRTPPPIGTPPTATPPPTGSPPTATPPPTGTPPTATPPPTGIPPTATPPPTGIPPTATPPPTGTPPTATPPPTGTPPTATPPPTGTPPTATPPPTGTPPTATPPPAETPPPTRTPPPAGTPPPTGATPTIAPVSAPAPVGGITPAAAPAPAVQLPPSSSPTPAAVIPTTSKKTSIIGPVVGGIAGAAALCALSLWLICVYCRRRSKNRTTPAEPPQLLPSTGTTADPEFVKVVIESGGTNGSHHRDRQAPESWNMTYTIDQLRAVTADFAEPNVLGRGGFGVVYKGVLPDGTKVAVKRMQAAVVSSKGLSEFQSEIAVLTKVKHRHLVGLLGYCTDGVERLLVYEYMAQGTLAQHLFKYREMTGKPLAWTTRLVIALDVAQGVEYLHSLAHRSFIHRDLKPSNVLLNEKFRAKVADFGLVKLAPDGNLHSVETRLAGTFGYLAPEYAATGRVTTKADVFSFGVILMELLTGRRAVDETLPEEDMYLVTWFAKRMRRGDDEVFRATIDATIRSGLDDATTRESVVAVAELAGHCTAREPSQRPDMGHVVSVLRPLVDEWKPMQHADSSTVRDVDMSLAQALKQWQESDFNSSAATDSSVSSLPARPRGFAYSFESAEGR